MEENDTQNSAAVTSVQGASQPDAGSIPELETKHGRISLGAGQTPGLWISSKKSNAMICLYVDSLTGQPVIGMYSDTRKATKGCNFAVSCDSDGEAVMQLTNNDGTIRMLKLSRIFDAIQALGHSVKGD